MDEASHCLDLVRSHDRDRFLASLFAPDERRPALLALYAFDLEISRIADQVSEPMVGQIRLQWWRETLEAAARGEAAGHPIAEQLGQAMHDWRLPLEPLLDLVSAHEFDMFGEPMRNVAALETYLGQTSSAVIQLAAIVLAGDAARRSAEAAGLAGVALGLARLVQRRMNGDESVAKYWPKHFDDGAAISLARRRLAEARALAATVSPQVLPAFLPVALTESCLAGRASPLRRQLRLWWSARRNRY